MWAQVGHFLGNPARQRLGVLGVLAHADQLAALFGELGLTIHGLGAPSARRVGIGVVYGADSLDTLCERAMKKF